MTRALDDAASASLRDALVALVDDARTSYARWPDEMQRVRMAHTLDVVRHPRLAWLLSERDEATVAGYAWQGSSDADYAAMAADRE